VLRGLITFSLLAERVRTRGTKPESLESPCLLIRLEDRSGRGFETERRVLNCRLKRFTDRNQGYDRPTDKGRPDEPSRTFDTTLTGFRPGRRLARPVQCGS
jgi:hypothetical protein